MERRQFLKNSAVAGAALAFSRAQVWAKDADARIEILLEEPLGEISPNIYGQFTEHIGGVIYDGVWVGEKSKIPNQYGIRSQLVDMMKQIHVPVIRWPGGCFADSYDWKDGIGEVRSGRAAPISGRSITMRSGCTTKGRSSSKPTNSAPMSSSGFAG